MGRIRGKNGKRRNNVIIITKIIKNVNGLFSRLGKFSQSLFPLATTSEKCLLILPTCLQVEFICRRLPGV